MRIVYGVFGYGRGHATRAIGVLPELVARHDVLLLAGGDAYDVLSQRWPVVRVPAIRFVYGPDGRRSNLLTFKENYAFVRDALFGGESARHALKAIVDFRPDVAICDVEPFTHQAAARLRIPRISFDHFGILAYCKPSIPWRDRMRLMRDVLLYRLMTGSPQRAIVSSFYSAPAAHRGVRCVGPLLRDEVLRQQPIQGDHLLVYLNNGAAQFSPRIEEALHGLKMPVVVYGTPRRDCDGDLLFRPPSNDAFLDDLARCRAVFSTAGNQLVGEAAHLGKPLLVMPENTVEQRLNAAAVERLGVGQQVREDTIDGASFQQFFARAPEYRDNAIRYARDGRGEAISALEAFAKELAFESSKPARAWRFA